MTVSDPTEAEAVAWRWRDKPGLWNHQGSTRNITHAEHEPLFPLSSLQTRDARIAELDVPCGECDAVSSAIGSVRWMDLPDGGSPTLAEQVSRMRADLAKAEAALEEAVKGLELAANRMDRLALGLPYGQRLDALDWTAEARATLNTIRETKP
jgi:hypothetical protein